MLKRLFPFSMMLGVATLIASAGAPLPRLVAGTGGAESTNTASAKKEAYYVGGHWTPTPTGGGSFVVMNGDGRNAYLGFMRSANKSKACEFAIGVDRDEVHFQIVDAQGNPHFVPVTALLKLKDAAADEKPKAKGSDAPVAAAAAKADDIPAGHRLLYKMARIRAAGELADKEKISRRAAREKIDDTLSDAQLHELVTAAGVTVKPQVSGGKVQEIIQWLIDHQDAIIAIVKIILALFNVNADVENSSIFMPHDWVGQLFAMAA